MNPIAINFTDEEGKIWMEIRTLGPHNAHDFPMWLRWGDGIKIFFRSKADLNVCWLNWRDARWWRQPWGDSGKYRVMELRGKFYPQEEIVVGEWWRLGCGESSVSLGDAKKRIEAAIQSYRPAVEIIHEYP